MSGKGVPDLTSRAPLRLRRQVEADLLEYLRQQQSSCYSIIPSMQARRPGSEQAGNRCYVMEVYDNATFNDDNEDGCSTMGFTRKLRVFLKRIEA